MTSTWDIKPAIAPEREAGASWLMLVVLLAGQFMALLDVTIVNVAMPTIGRSLHASGAELQLVVAGYTVSYAMLLITGARLGDLAGRRRMFMFGTGLFTLASLTCGLASRIGSVTGVAGTSCASTGRSSARLSEFSSRASSGSKTTSIR